MIDSCVHVVSMVVLVAAIACEPQATRRPPPSGQACTGDAECDDGNPCTDDVCAADGCVSTANTASCDDADSCTAGDRCDRGACVGARELCCDDRINNDGDGVTDCDDPDCSGVAVCDDGCPAVAPVDDSPLPIESAASVVESTTADGFADDYVYNAAGTLKLGTRRDWGGAIVFFGLDDGSPGLNSTNAIDSADTGREVQVAFYDVDRWYQSCAWNASCNATPSPSTCPLEMTWLGWNPVQGGNRCNNGSGVDDVVLGGGAIEVTTTPLFWNPNWDRSDCVSDACGDPTINRRRSDIQVRQRVRFVRPNVVELDYVVTNLAGVDHAVSTHELPTVYTAFGRMGTPDLHRLFDSTRTEVAIDRHPPTDTAFRYRNFTSPGGWVTLQNTVRDYGVGVFYENGLSGFQAWQADDPDFNNVRGLLSFAIPAFGQVRARAYLILGSLDTVAAEAQWLRDNLPPFGSLDAPAGDAPISGVVAVHGWAMDDDGVVAVQLVVDGGPPIPLSYGGSRPDVCAVWPGYPQCASHASGFSGSFDAETLAPGECGHILEVVAFDTTGNSRVIARRRVHRAE